MDTLYVDYIVEDYYSCLGVATLNRGAIAFLNQSDRLRIMGFKVNALGWLPKAVKLKDVLKEIATY